MRPLPLLPLALLPLLAGCLPHASVEPRALTTESRANPRGIETTTPRLSFKPAATDPAERGVFVKSLRLIAAASPDDLAAERNLLWDYTQAIPDGQNWDHPLTTTQIPYAGQPLAPRSTVYWKVRCTDQLGRDSGWSAPASFSIGLLDQADWDAADWIGLDAAPEAPLTDALRDDFRKLPWIRQPGPPARQQRQAVFTSSFTVKDTPIAEAFFAGCIDQFGSIVVNKGPGSPIHRWDPLRPINVKPSLTPGRNTLYISAIQEDGFNPAATGMLIVRYADKTEQRFPLDKSWTFVDPSSDKPTEAHPAEEARGQPWGGNRNTEHFMGPAPYLRTTFTTSPGKSIAHATLYATALGLYEPHLNGRRVGRDELTPGWTEYTKRVEHQTYDVTDLLTTGDNCLGAILGDGWYAGLMGYTGKRHFYGGPARFKARLEITFTDGTTQLITTSPEWTAAFGPIRHTDNYMGSAYDARLEIPGWDTTAFNAPGWSTPALGLGKHAPAPRQVDVTDKIRALLSSPNSLKVGPDTLGEPCFGVVKTLRIDMTTHTGAHTLTFKEGETVNLPRPGEKDTTIVKAVFGEPTPPPAPAFVIEPSRAEPVRRFEELATVAITQPRPGRYIFDLGQNMVGWARIKVRGKAGQTLTLRHAEMLNPDGTPYTSNLRGATATDFVTLRDGWQTIEPPFTFHGFRYVEVWGLTEAPTPDMVTGIVVHSDLTPSGSFATDNPLVNQLVRNIIWGQKGNYLEVPTDCPQRDERLGWTGDAQFFVKAASYNFDIGPFMTRWIKTLAQDAQFEDGTFAHVAPKANERGGSTAWGDAAIVCTHAMYRAYGDTRVIADNYAAMARYTSWLDSRTRDGIAHVGGFGDWLNLDDATHSDLIDTAQRILLLGDMAEMADALGKTDDASSFSAKREASIAAFRRRFLADDGSLRDSGQTGYALAFTIPGILPDNLRAKAADHFAHAIERKNNHLATGFIGTPRLLPALFNADRTALAQKLLLTEDYPSWLYQVKLGATTMWERWDGWTPEKGFQDVGMNSFNHYAFGAVGDALFSRLGGISALSPAYRTTLIEPRPVWDSSTPALRRVSASYDSPQGMTRSAWSMDPAGTLACDITVPPNTWAEIRLHVPFDADVTESGQRFDLITGVEVLPNLTPATPETGGTVRLRAPSGTYHFRIVPPTTKP